MSKYLIINADDYGMSQSANEAIEALFDQGCLTSTTLMAPCPWAEDALARAKGNPRMRVGLHSTLTSEWVGYRWGPLARGQVASLLDPDGYFHSQCEPLLAQCSLEDVATELAAQLDFFLHRGMKPTHMDNHMGSVYGLYGKPLMAQVFALCAAHGLPFRLPRQLHLSGIPDGFVGALADMVRAADQLHIGTLDCLVNNGQRFSQQDGYDALKRSYLALLPQLQEGVSEMYMHPACDSRELRAMTPTWFTRVWEYQLLMDPDFSAAIEEHGIQLTTWEEAPLKGRQVKAD